ESCRAHQRGGVARVRHDQIDPSHRGPRHSPRRLARFAARTPAPFIGTLKPGCGFAAGQARGRARRGSGQTFDMPRQIEFAGSSAHCERLLQAVEAVCVLTGGGSIVVLKRLFLHRRRAATRVAAS
ncbi:hypothetical protein, partial [Phenylobacterium sp.]|uniref:hypothetical protein n=1 Tax=Phenylobacterium sp. TaxID=1871053 RepID=UPI002FDA638E